MGETMDIEKVRELFDDELRKNIEYPGAEREQLEHVTRFIWPRPGKSFVLWCDLDEANADEIISEQMAYFEQRNLPFEWKVFAHDRPSDLAERIEKRGLIPEEMEAIMVLDLEDIPEVLRTPITVDIRRLESPQELDGVISVLTAVWGGNFDWVHSRIGDHMRVPGYMSVYLGYHEDQPVSVAWTYFHDGHFASLWAGSTVESMRGQGFYKALLATRIQEAIQRGKRYVTVDTGPMSQPIVTRLGFRELTKSASLEWEGIKPDQPE